MSRRHTDALAIAAGACNPLAIANSISRGLNEIREQPGGWSTQDMTRDPSIKLMVAQLAYLTGVRGGVKAFAQGADFRECEDICREADQPNAPLDNATKQTIASRAAEVLVLDREEA